MRETDKILLAMTDVKTEGNIIDNEWINNLKYPNGKTNMNAVVVLSEIVYWYKPVIEKDEKTGKIKSIRKKFKGDKLQKSYEALGNRFGLTKIQAKLACNFLKEREIISLDFRTIETNDKRILNNVMFIDLNVENLKKITGKKKVEKKKIFAPENNNQGEKRNYIENEVEMPGNIEIGGHQYYNKGDSEIIISESPKIDVHTNTYNTTEITTKTILNNNNTKNEYSIKSKTKTENIAQEKKKYYNTDILDEKIRKDLKYLKEKINKTTKGHIQRDRLKSMYENKGFNTINYYLDNFHKFKTNKHNAVGYFIKAVENEWFLPSEYKSDYKTEQKPIQSTNFDQREYDNDYFENLYANKSYIPEEYL